MPCRLGKHSIYASAVSACLQHYDVNYSVCAVCAFSVLVRLLQLSSCDFDAKSYKRHCLQILQQ